MMLTREQWYTLVYNPRMRAAQEAITWQTLRNRNTTTC